MITITASTPRPIASRESSIVSRVEAVPVPATTAARPAAARSVVWMTAVRSSRVRDVASPVQPHG